MNFDQITEDVIADSIRERSTEIAEEIIMGMVDEYEQIIKDEPKWCNKIDVENLPNTVQRLSLNFGFLIQRIANHESIILNLSERLNRLEKK